MARLRWIIRTPGTSSGAVPSQAVRKSWEYCSPLPGSGTPHRRVAQVPQEIGQAPLPPRLSTRNSLSSSPLVRGGPLRARIEIGDRRSLSPSATSSSPPSSKNASARRAHSGRRSSSSRSGRCSSVSARASAAPEPTTSISACLPRLRRRSHRRPPRPVQAPARHDRVQPAKKSSPH
jgi:hypothetical protein